MNYLVIFYYIFSLLSGSVAIFLSFFAFLKYKNKISLAHLFFQIILFFFVFTHTIYFYFYVIDFKLFNYVYVFNIIYLFLLSLLFYIVPFLSFCLIEKEIPEIFNKLFLFLTFTGVLLIFIVVLNRLDEKFSSSLIFFYSIALIIIVISSLLIISSNIKKMQDIRKSIMKKIIVVVILFLPAFLMDANFEVLQNRLKVIPKLFNFIALFYIVWNVWTIYYAFIFLDRITDNSAAIIELPEDFIKFYKINDREKKILEMLIAGYTNKEIANKLCLSEGTIKNYIYVIFQKVDISNRMQIVKKINDFIKKNF